MTTSPSKPGSTKRNRPRLAVGLTAILLVLCAAIASLILNRLLYREADVYYREVAMVRLDPYGLKQPIFPADAGSADPSAPVVEFFGDSRALDWPALPLTNMRFVNRGIWGQTTEQIRGRFDAHVIALHPSVLVLQAGVNDLKAIAIFPDRRDEIVAA